MSTWHFLPRLSLTLRSKWTRPSPRASLRFAPHRDVCGQHRNILGQHRELDGRFQSAKEVTSLPTPFQCDVSLFRRGGTRGQSGRGRRYAPRCGFLPTPLTTHPSPINPKPPTRNPKPNTRNPKPEARNRKWTPLSKVDALRHGADPNPETPKPPTPVTSKPNPQKSQSQDDM